MMIWENAQRPANNTWLHTKIANVSSGLLNGVAQPKNESGQTSAGSYSVLIVKWVEGAKCFHLLDLLS